MGMMLENLVHLYIQSTTVLCDNVDSGCQNGHYICRATGSKLAGHPLTCTVGGCSSKLRTLRAAALHYPRLRTFLNKLYEAMRKHSDQMQWRMCASTTLLPNTPSLVWTEMPMWCTRHWKNRFSQITKCSIRTKKIYFYSLLLLFVFFHNEADLIAEGENAEIAFNRHVKENNTLNMHSEKLQRMMTAKGQFRSSTRRDRHSKRMWPSLDCLRTTAVLRWPVKPCRP